MKKVIYENGCVVSVCRMMNGRYAYKTIRLTGAITLGDLTSLHGFIWADGNNIMKDTCKVCDIKSFGKDETPNKKAKLIDFGRDWTGKETADEEE